MIWKSANGAPARNNLIESALRLEWLTAVWMLIETGVAIGSGIAAHSLTLIAFGADSVIELVSALLLLWRLTIELQRGEDFPEKLEKRAAKLGAALLLALSVYVIVSAAWALRGCGGGGAGRAVLSKRMVGRWHQCPRFGAFSPARGQRGLAGRRRA